jgi:transposase
LRAQNALLVAQNAALLARVTELERQLGLNSGKPPSGDGLKKKPARVSSLRERSGKKPGGQQGHPGKTLRRAETPNVTIDHFPPTCDGCGAALSEAMATGHTARQVFDLPEPQPLVVTEHRAHQCQCTACGTRTRASRGGQAAAWVSRKIPVVKDRATLLYWIHDSRICDRRATILVGLPLTGYQLVSRAKEHGWGWTA